MTQPLVSVIIPTYNRELFVSRAVESVLAQTYTQWELIVVDDGSTDDTRKVLAKYEPSITVLSQANRGAYPARNFALQHARGELIAFLDSDDVWLPHRLEVQLPLMRSGVGLVYGDMKYRKVEGDHIRPLNYTVFSLAKPHRGRVAAQLVRHNFVPQSTVLIRRECFTRLGEFSLVSPMHADYAKWLQVSFYYDLDYVTEPICEYTFHGGNMEVQASEAYFRPVALFEELAVTTSDTSFQPVVRRAIFFHQLRLSHSVFRSLLSRVWRLVFRPQGVLSRSSITERLAFLLDYFWASLTR